MYAENIHRNAHLIPTTTWNEGVAAHSTGKNAKAQ